MSRLYKGGIRMKNFLIVLHAMFIFTVTTIIAFIAILGVMGIIYNIFLRNKEKLLYKDYENHIIKPSAKKIMNILFYVIPPVIGFACAILNIM